MGDILTGTPPELTYEHPIVREAWTVVWGIASGALIVILGWIGLSLMMQHHLGQNSTGWWEAIPRLVLGLVAAATSYWWCALIIDVAHNVSKYVAAALEVSPGDLLRAPLDTFLRTVNAGSVGMSLLLALIDILLALAPIALGLWILAPHRGLGSALAEAFPDHGVPAGGAADSPGHGVRVPEAVRSDRGIRAGPRAGVEAAALDCLRLHGYPGALDAGQRRHLRLLGEHPLLRHVASGNHPALGEERRIDCRGGGRGGTCRSCHGGGGSHCRRTGPGRCGDGVPVGGRRNLLRHRRGSKERQRVTP